MRTIRIWVDDIRPMPTNYDFHYKSVWEFIRNFGEGDIGYECDYVIDLDHDAGDYERYGGDYYNILKWFEFHMGYDNTFFEHCTFKFHTANPVGRQNMINICERNCWKYD